jgi:hypothetical protein
VSDRPGIILFKKLIELSNPLNDEKTYIPADPNKVVAMIFNSGPYDPKNSTNQIVILAPDGRAC